ncbi:MAG: DUF433 domain-containing protein [Armatimonadetes bacterium]|nr:DUF433 domain-containing protein [Armatimonadota bacterium]
MTPVTINLIEVDEDGVAWIMDTGTKVSVVVIDKLAFGWDAEQIAQDHEHLSLAHIHAALAYYYTHQSEIDAEIAEEDRFGAECRAAAPLSPFFERMRREGRWPPRHSSPAG